VLRERGHDVRVINAGVSGETTAGGLRRASFIASQQADIVIVALGGNDMLRGTPPSAVEEQLRQLLTILRTGESRILLVGMRASQNLGPNYVADFDAIYPRLAEEFSVPLVPFLLEGIALDPALNQADGIHPNTRGAELIASTLILPAVELLLPASTSD
jgi:acyl-CoA thioesterase-1